MGVIERYLAHIQRHFGAYFWVCWGLIIPVGLLELTTLPGWLSGILALPLNLLSWPVVISFWMARADGAKTYRPVERMAFAQVVITTLMPFFYFFG